MSQDNNDFNNEYGEHVDNDFTTRDLRDNPDSVSTQPSGDAVEAEYAEFVQEHPADFTQPGADPMDAPYADGVDGAAHEDLTRTGHSRHEKLTPDQLGEGIVKFATDTAYAAVGFAGLVGDKAKAFYDDQKRQYAETHPETPEREAGAKDFLNQLKEQLDKFFDDLTRGYRDMAERGRETASKQGSPFARREDAGTVPAPVVDDLSDDAAYVADPVDVDVDGVDTYVATDATRAATFGDVGDADYVADDFAAAPARAEHESFAGADLQTEEEQLDDVSDFGRPAEDFVAPGEVPDGVNNSDYTEDGEEAELDEYGNPVKREGDDPLDGGLAQPDRV